MDSESIFDEDLLSSEDWGVPFQIITSAVDGFALFHEAGHILAADPFGDRTLEKELDADVSATSLTIIDGARTRMPGAYHMGAPVYFRVESLRLLIEEIRERIDLDEDSRQMLRSGIEELLLRAKLYYMHVRKFTGDILNKEFSLWSSATNLVFDTVRWALLDGIGRSTDMAGFVLNHQDDVR